MGERTLWLGEASWSGAHLTVTYGVDDHRSAPRSGGRASTSTRWRSTIGPERLRRLVFHIAAFEAMKGGQPAARRVRPRALRRPRHGGVPDAVVHRAPPRVGAVALRARPRRLRRPDDRRCRRRRARHPVARGAADPSVLLFCGGGKDSLVAARVLEEAGVPYAQLRLLALHLRAARSRSTPSSTGCSTTSRPTERAPALGVRRPPRRARRAARARARHPIGHGGRDAQLAVRRAARSRWRAGCTDLVARPRAQRRRRQPRVGPRPARRSTTSGASRSRPSGCSATTSTRSSWPACPTRASSSRCTTC